MTTIYHITHIDNLQTIVQLGGLWCDSECDKQSIASVGIAYANLKNRRRRTQVPLKGGVLADYVPFYFANRSPMLGAIHMGRVDGYSGGQESVVYLISSVELIAQTKVEWCFSDGHAVESLTRYFDTLSDLSNLDWPVIQSWRWQNTLEDPDRMRRKQAEFLVHSFFSWAWVESVAVMTPKMAHQAISIMQPLSPKLVAVQPRWYYDARK